MFDFNPGASRAIGDETHFDFRGELHAGIGFPIGADLPAHDEPLAGFPDAYMSDDDLGTVLARRVPAPANEGFDDRFLDGRRADAMRFRPPAVDAGGEH